MQANEVERLKIQAEKFYLDLHPGVPQMSDAEYDALAKQYEAETGKSVKDLIDWNQVGEVEQVRNLPSLKKIQVKDNDLASAVKKWIKEKGCEAYYLNLKYDGSSIRAFYKDGKLCKVTGSPDESKAILRTSTMAFLFPQTLEDKSIESIVGEVVADPKIFGYNSRNKANGMCNSKNMVEEIRKYAMVRAYRITFYGDDISTPFDFDRHSEALSELPTLYDESGKCYFKEAVRLSIDQIPETSINSSTGECMQADGVVLYSDKGLQAFKFYFNEFQNAVVKRISYKLQKTGNLYPLLHFDPIVVEGKKIGKCAGGSLNTIKKIHAGVGSTVSIILSNGVIPKVLKVVNPSDDFQIPEDLKQYE